MTEFIGETFAGQYKIREFVADNGIVQTYRAFQNSLKRVVAVHILNEKSRLDPYWRRALARGAEIAAQFEHPNIVPVVDYGTHKGVEYAIARDMPGGTLHMKLKAGTLERSEVATTINQISAALDFVHAQGSCHGDPAPANIIFDQSGNAHVADFYLLGRLEVVAAEEVAGTLGFMSLERMRPNPPTPLSDQYALAALAYLMLTGKQPPLAFNLDQMVAVHEHRAEIPPDVNAVVLRGMAELPEHRFPTIMDFARQFEQALKSAPQHVFISYSRRDSDYVQRLKDHLQANKLQIWVDDQIEHGDQWFNVIHEAIKTSAAFLVVMSPEAEQSEWVHKEILLAKRYRKPIFPLLLSGMEMPILIDLQFADVRDETMPNVNFYRRLTHAVYGI